MNLLKCPDCEFSVENSAERPEAALEEITDHKRWSHSIGADSTVAVARLLAPQKGS